MKLELFSHLKGRSIRATDGEIGKIKDLYFDDSFWTARYLVVDTGNWLNKRSVLISPVHIPAQQNWSGPSIAVDLTMDKVKNSPSVDSDRPVSRQEEEHYWNYYNFPYYWSYPGIWGFGIYPADLYDRSLTEKDFKFNLFRHNEDPHLRSANEVIGYSLDTLDGRMGSVDDLSFHGKTWSIRYLDVDTVRWWPSKHVLLSVDWIAKIDWVEKIFTVDLKKETIKNSPEFEPKRHLTRQYEERLHAYYNRVPYWYDLDQFTNRRRTA
ncbi:MAG: photosystem reaction center subunit [Bacteriovoracaceae bacterium]|nr:photosystem reaction center subunit [Bacteriovoracaceae bacterium]